MTERGRIKLVAGCLIALLALIFQPISCTTIKPGEVGIKVNMFGEDRGVDSLTAETGIVLYNKYTTQIKHYPTYVQTAIWTQSKHEGKPIDESISFNSSEGLVISADISLSYEIEQNKVPHFYVKFRSDDLDIFTHGFLRNIARDAFNEVGALFTIEQIYGTEKEKVVTDVRNKINTQTKDFGVVLTQFGYTGAPRLPQSVVTAMNAKIQATQDAIRTENELRQARAEAQKKIAEAEGIAKSRIAVADGEAKANKVLAESITKNLLDWKNLEILADSVKKWDGRRPMVEGQGSGLLMNVPLPQNK